MDQFLTLLKPWYLAIGFFVAFCILRLLLFPILKNILHHATTKLNLQLVDDILTGFEEPLNFQLFVLGFYFFFVNAPLHSSMLLTFVERFLRSSIIFSIFWGLYNVSGTTHSCMINLMRKLGIEPHASTTSPAEPSKESAISRILSTAIHILIVVIGFVAIAKEWNYDVTGFIASLSIGSVAVAFAAKDTLANVFGSLVIILDKPFLIGDWISANGIEGTVEKVTFRSTCIRTFDQERVYIPNSLLANTPIQNYSVRAKRRIHFTMTLEYGTPRDKIEAFMQEVRKLLASKAYVDKETIDVVFKEYNASSLDIYVRCYTQINDEKKNIPENVYWGYLNEINLDLMDIIEQVGVSCAFPSTSVYFGNDLQTQPQAPVQNK